MKKIYFLFMFALIASIGNLYAATVTFDATKDKSSTMTLTKDGVTLSLSKGDGSSVGKLDNGTDYRPYAKNTLTISSEYTITKIVFTCTKDGKTKGGPGNFNVTNGGGAYKYKGKVGTWTGSAASITFYANAQVQATTIEVTYDFVEGARCATPTFSVEEGTFTEAQTITLTPGEVGAQVYYTINGGAEQPYAEPIRLEEDGTYKIAAYTAATETLAKSATVTKTYVINLPLEEPYILCKDAAWLTNGAKVIFVGKNESASTTFGMASQNTEKNYRGQGVVTLSEDGNFLNHKDAEVRVFSVERSGDKMAFKDVEGYLYTDNTKNEIKTSETITEDCYWTVSIGTNEKDKEAAVVSSSVTNRNIKYNASANPNRFAVYNVTVKNLGEVYIYLLGSTSSVSSMSAEGVKVFAAEGGVEVVAAEATDVAVYTVAGQLVRQARVAEGNTLVNVAPGFYVVRANGTATKVIVR